MVRMTIEFKNHFNWSKGGSGLLRVTCCFLKSVFLFEHRNCALGLKEKLGFSQSADSREQAESIGDLAKQSEGKLPRASS